MKPFGAHFVGWSLSWLSGQKRYWSDWREWKDLMPDGLIKHTSHRFVMPEGHTEDIGKVPADTEDLVTMFVKPPGGDGMTPELYRRECTERLERLHRVGWRSVICHDLDVVSDVGDFPIRHRMELEITTTDSRNKVIIDELARKYYPHHRVDEQTIGRIALMEAHRSSSFKPVMDGMVREWVDRGLAAPISVMDLLSGDRAKIMDLMAGLDLSVVEDRVQEWVNTQKVWADRNRFIFTWRSMVPGWCDDILSGQDREMPDLDHYQMAVLQRHLMLNHGCRLNDMTQFTNSQGYHANLRLTRS